MATALRAGLRTQAQRRVASGPATPPDVVADVELMVELLRALGHRVEYVPGWEGRGSGSFRRIRTRLDHHDAFPARTGHAGGLRTCTFGRPDLRNSLCMFYLASDGTIYVVAARVSWHAGKGRRTTNTESSGIEARNDGVGEPWPAVQLAAYCDLDALAVIFWDVEVLDHKEHSSTGKVDRKNIDPSAWRTRVAHRVVVLRGWLAGHTNPTTEEFTMDAAAKAEFDRLHRRLDTFEKGVDARLDRTLKSLTRVEALGRELDAEGDARGKQLLEITRGLMLHEAADQKRDEAAHPTGGS